MKMKYLLFSISLISSVVFDGYAYQANDATKTISSDGSWLDTSAAVTYATAKNQDGWVLTVGAPGGSYVWPNVLPIGSANVFTIQGASTNNRPTIIFTTTGNSGIYMGLGSKVVTIRDFIFDVGTTKPYSNLIGIDGSGVCFRVTNCRFQNAAQLNFGIQVGSINANNTMGPFGLVDNCQFSFPGGLVYNYINVRANGNVNGYGWTQPMSWGTVNAVVVESCTFSQKSAAPVSGLVEADGGARLVIRHNTITNIPESTHGLNSGAHLSTLQIECYQNQWVLNDTNNTMPYVYLQRGGTAVIWSNIVSSTSYWNASAIFTFWVEAASTYWQAEWFPRQLLYPADYPATQQIGQGVVNGAAGLVPTYIWGNTTPNALWGVVALGMNVDAPFIQQGRDIYTNSVMQNYTPLVYPHPLVSSSVYSPPGSGAGTNGTATVFPPANLQVHPSTNE